MMLLGLTNALTIFMTLMKILFCKHLGKFVLICMDNILICFKTVEEHKEHLTKCLIT